MEADRNEPAAAAALEGAAVGGCEEGGNTELAGTAGAPRYEREEDDDEDEEARAA